MLLETLMSDPDSVQKAPSRVNDFWCFSGPGVGGFGARLTIELYSRPGALVRQATCGEPAEPNLSAYARQPARGPC